jgi:hypothetical protein
MPFRWPWQSVNYSAEVHNAAVQDNFGRIAELLQQDVATSGERKAIVTATAQAAANKLGLGEVDSFWVLAGQLAQYATNANERDALVKPFKYGFTHLCIYKDFASEMDRKLEQVLPRAAKTFLAGQDDSYWQSIGLLLLEAKCFNRLDSAASILNNHVPETMAAYSGLCHAGAARLHYLANSGTADECAMLLVGLAQRPQLMAGVTPEIVAAAGRTILEEGKSRDYINFATVSRAVSDQPALARALTTLPAARDVILFSAPELGDDSGPAAVLRVGLQSRVISSDDLSQKPLRSYIESVVSSHNHPAKPNGVALIFERLAQKAAQTDKTPGNFAALDLLALQPYYEARWRHQLEPLAQSKIDTVYRWSNQILSARKLVAT